MNKVITFGCSHTDSTITDNPGEVWAEQLELMLPGSTLINKGKSVVSADYIARIIPDILQEYKPECIFILWPDWTRFEYIDKSGKICQSLPTDNNRIYFMEEWTEEKLRDNFEIRRQEVINYCEKLNIDVFELTLYDLIDIIDHADCWPNSSDNAHYDVHWHTLIAQIFRYKLHCKVTNEKARK
jgi:hypothetical protein